MHAFQYVPPKQVTVLVKALRAPAFPPAPTKSSMLCLARCASCRHRDPHLLEKLERLTHATENVTHELSNMHRKLAYLLQCPGGPQQLPECIDDAVAIDPDMYGLLPKIWECAVSPRFLRRLCKMYTASDLIVDHQIPVLHSRSDVDRSPHLGECYVGDRYKCVGSSVVSL